MKRKWTMLAALLAAAAVGTGVWAAPQTVGIPQIAWQSAGTLSPAKGQSEQLGVAGVVQGTSCGYAIVGGGANFPQGSPAAGGQKVAYRDIYVMKVSDQGLEETDHQELPYPAAYGSSVIAPDGVYYIGGSPDAKGAKSILKLTANTEGKLQVQTVGELPFSFQNGVAAYADGALYLGLGKQDGQLSRQMYRYDLGKHTLTALPPFPGTAREQAVSQILNNRLYIFSGGSQTAYTDGYAYDLQSRTWHEAAPVQVDGQEISLLGAASVKLNENEMLVIGGFNKEVYNWAVTQLSSLQGTALKQFKAQYFGAEPASFHWNQEILIYNGKTDTWRSAGQIPFAAPCGEGLILTGDYLVSVNGEIKPGVRSNRIYEGLILRK